MTEAGVAQIKADMNRVGLAYALLIADQFKDTRLRRSGDPELDFQNQLIAAYSELERTSNSGTKQYWCSVIKRWFSHGDVRAALWFPHQIEIQSSRMSF